MKMSAVIHQKNEKTINCKKNEKEKEIINGKKNARPHEIESLCGLFFSILFMDGWMIFQFGNIFFARLKKKKIPMTSLVYNYN